MRKLAKGSVKPVLEGDLALRIHTIKPGECSFNVASQQIEAWRRVGGFSVFHAGAYDLLTLNHIVGLTECRILGAMALLDIEQPETEAQERLVHEVAASDAIRLMVTLDTNQALEHSKSRRLEKGGSPRPTLDWYTRAMMLAMQSIPTPEYNSRRNLVDFITRHGPCCCESCASGTCVNEDNAWMTVQLQPNLVVVNADSATTVRDIESYCAEGLLPNTTLVLVDESYNQYEDPVLGGPVKTKTIIDRVRS